MLTRRDRRRREIQRLAAELFLERGYDAVSVRDLAEAAGVTLPTLYWYIGSKPQLLQDIYLVIQEENLRRFEEVDGSDEPPERKLRALVLGTLQLSAGDMRAEAGVFLSEGQRFERSFMEAQQDTRDRIDGIVRNVLEAGAATGAWPARRLLVTRMTFWAMANFVHRWYRPGGALSIQEVATQVGDILIGGLAGPPSVQRNADDGATPSGPARSATRPLGGGHSRP